MNEKIKEFKKEIESAYNRQGEYIEKSTDKALEAIETINFEVFTNENPYRGETENKVFFTYSNHYRGNSPLWMGVCELHHPHKWFEDRGYIKGVATDLAGYVKLRRLTVTHNFDNCVYIPTFRRTKNYEKNRETCQQIVDGYRNRLDEAVKNANEKINERLKEKTGCSLLHYIRPI